MSTTCAAARGAAPVPAGRLRSPRICRAWSAPLSFDVLLEARLVAGTFSLLLAAWPPRRQLRRAPASRLRRAAAGDAVAAAPASDAQDGLTDLDLLAELHIDVGDLAGDRRRHFDGGLVGFELEDRLVLRDRVAGIHHDAEDVASRRRALRVRAVGSLSARGISADGQYQWPSS